MRKSPTEHFGDAHWNESLATRFIVAICLQAVLPAWVGCDLVPQPTAPPRVAGQNETSILTVNVARAKLSENVDQSATSFGTIKPRRSSSLAFARAGRVKNVFFNVGDLVSEGDKIAELDQGEMLNQQADLDYVLTALNEELRLLESGTDIQGQRRKQEEIDELSAQQQRLTREFQKGFIVAPYRGVLAERNAEIGDAVPAGRPFFRILEAEQPIVELSVPVRIAELVPVGTEVWVKYRQQKIYATVATKAPELDASSRTQSLTLSLQTNDQTPTWNYGEVVEVWFFIATERDGFWLPYSALQSQGNGLWSVFVLEGDGAQQKVGRKLVSLVQLDDTAALVNGSLLPGELFIVDGLNRVVPGQLVQANVVPDEYAPAKIAGAGQ